MEDNLTLEQFIEETKSMYVGESVYYVGGGVELEKVVEGVFLTNGYIGSTGQAFEFIKRFIYNITHGVKAEDYGH